MQDPLRFRRKWNVRALHNELRAQTVDVVLMNHVGPGCRDPDVAFDVDYRVPIGLAAFRIVLDRTTLVLQPDQRGDYS